MFNRLVLFSCQVALSATCFSFGTIYPRNICIVPNIVPYNVLDIVPKALSYRMNKLHWISVLLLDAPDDVVQLLTSVSYEATKTKKARLLRA